MKFDTDGGHLNLAFYFLATKIRMCST